MVLSGVTDSHPLSGYLGPVHEHSRLIFSTVHSSLVIWSIPTIFNSKVDVLNILRIESAVAAQGLDFGGGQTNINNHTDFAGVAHPQ